MLEKRIIWQPVGFSLGRSCDFDILLDREFAQEMLSIKLDEDLRQKMNNLMKEIGSSSFNPSYLFFKDTAFVLQFSLGEGTKWLAVNETYGKNPLEVFREGPIRYSSHNINNSTDAYSLMTFVNIWVKYSDSLKELTSQQSASPSQ